MTNKIRILSDRTINQIAAGEVIENPASVIKELIENAIDSGASWITLEILGGGFQWIKISDDGSGMTPEDAVLCLERYATSKIVDADDLYSLTTMGFRGEALASIAAISKMTLLTALENAPAVFLEVEGGIVSHIEPGARSRGTTIEIRSLFYNVPARKKFQKSATASHAEITKIVTQLALAHPEVGFELIQQKRSQFSLPASSGEEMLILLKRRAAALLGDAFLHSSYLLERGEEDYKALGLIADPLFSRHNRSGQSLFVNRRPVHCPLISYAIRDAYGTRLGTDRHPVYLLHLSIPSPLIDVNVHPQKKEIRLREEKRVRDILHSAVNRSLSVSEHGEDCGNILPFERMEPKTQNKREFSSFFSDLRPDFSQPLLLKEERMEPSQEIPLFDSAQEIPVIGLYRHYLIVESEAFPRSFLFDSRGIVWVDLFAVEARLHFNTLMQNAEAVLGISQGLLIPLTLSFSRAEAELLKTHLEPMQKLGIQMREIGETVFLVEAIPPFLSEEEVRIALEEMMGELQGMQRGKTLDEEKKRRLASCLCQRVKSRKKSYTLVEANHLVKQLLQADDPFHCPHGKKTLFYVREEEIENYFTRKTASSGTVEALTERFEKNRA
jgi:DNA mismatch repair protein MutL